MRISRIGIVWALALALALPAFAAAATFVVEMTTVDGEPRFVPADLRIEPGDTVRWLNTDLYLEHSVSSGSGSADPRTGFEFASPLLRLGESFDHTFNQTGDFEYYSIPHEYEGMFGVVHVGSSTPVNEMEISTWGKLKQRFSDLLPRD